MVRTFAPLILLLLTTNTAFADIVVRQKVDGTGLAAMAQGTTTVSIKGLKMRSESDGVDQVTIIDGEARRMWVIDTKKKRAESFDMTPIAREHLGMSPQAVSAKLEKGTGTREIAGYTAEQYQLEVKVVATAPDGSPLTTVVTGPVWIAADAPGREDYAAFYTALAESGLFLMHPDAVKAQPGQAKSWTEMYRKLAETGVPLASELSMRFEGSGMMAAIFAKMGNMTTSNTTISIDTNDLPDSLFAVPAGFKVK